MKYLLRYVSVDGYEPIAEANIDAHWERVVAFQKRGVLLMAGRLDEPVDGEALSLFTTREAAVEFAEGDPFVRNGVVASWTVRAWREVLAP